MSDEDKTRWNERFDQGAYAARTHPSALLIEYAEYLSAVESAKALDVACGAGRNTHYLCEQGFSLTSVDIADKGLERLVAGARPKHTVHTICHDLESGLPELEGNFDVIVMMRYLNLALIGPLCKLLAPDGVFFCEVLLENQGGASVGPGAGRFRASAGALRQSFSGMELLHDFEGSLNDPDGKLAHVAQVIAKRS
ncbi:MAG: class I SAM-dependent methyltransferase [Pseudomonadales bacterium]